MTEINTRPETPTIDVELGVKDTKVVKSIADRLGGGEKQEVKDNSNEPIAKNPRMVDLNNFTTEQIQDLQEQFAATPRRKQEVENYHTVELRQINGKTIVEWGQSYFDLKRDPVNRKDVMKTMIPVRFNGEEEFVDVLWREEFMKTSKVVCRVIKMDKEEVSETVGKTFKRNEDGAYTSQIVEMYVNKVKVTMTVKLPTGEEITLGGEFVN